MGRTRWARVTQPDCVIWPRRDTCSGGGPPAGLGASDHAWHNPGPQLGCCLRGYLPNVPNPTEELLHTTWPFGSTSRQSLELLRVVGRKRCIVYVFRQHCNIRHVRLLAAVYTVHSFPDHPGTLPTFITDPRKHDRYWQLIFHTCEYSAIPPQVVSMKTDSLGTENGGLQKHMYDTGTLMHRSRVCAM